MSTKHWDQQVSYIAPEEMSGASVDRWYKFIVWYDDLVRWVISASPYAEDVGISSAQIEEWLWTTGVNALLEISEYQGIAARFDAMPEFPLEWPNTHPATEVCERLSALHESKPLKMQEDAFFDIARELRQQAIKLLKLAELADEAPESMAVERAEAAVVA